MKNKTTNAYKNLSHFVDMINMNNKILPYTNKQFEDDFAKWTSNIKTIKYHKIIK